MAFSKNPLAIAVVAVSVLGMLASGGCGPRDPAAALKARAQAFWDAKVAKDHARSHAYLEPVWKAKMPLETWITSHGLVEWPRAEVWNVIIRGSKGTACVQYDFVVRGGAVSGESGTAEVGEPWVQVRGVWYKEEVAPLQTPAAPAECGPPPTKSLDTGGSA